MKTKPRVLLATTCRWLSAARLGMALSDCGCEIEAVCPPGHLLTGIRAVTRTHRYQAFRSVASFKAAIERSKPDLVVPCDELAVNTLYRLYQDADSAGRSAIGVLLRRSLGDPSSFGVLSRRSDTLAAAHEEGIAIPETAAVRNADELLQWLDRHGFPAVLKADGTAGGRGVQIVRTREEARRAFRIISAPPSAARAFKRALVDRDLTVIPPWFAREHPQVSVQHFVSGSQSTSNFACWEGEVLACLTFDVVRTWKPGGPASVLRVVENAAISEAARKLARRMRLSGFYGLDFILEGATGRAYLIEVNARSTQTCHLPFGPGRDLPAALAAALEGSPGLQGGERLAAIANRQVALFPLELQRNPASRFLESAYHDVPWTEPDLVNRVLNEPAEYWPLRWYEALAKFGSKRRDRFPAGNILEKDRIR